MVSTAFGPAAPLQDAFGPRFAPAVQLFAAILARIQRACEAAKVELVVATLAGKSYVEQPGSVSGQYQEYFRGAVAQAVKAHGLHLLDLAARLREPQPGHPGTWFFPHDGHLTPAGHQLIADLLVKELPPVGAR
jgi:lysophospholipase L1-like esterase